MKFGLTPHEYDYITEHLVAPLAAQGAEVFCYGSRARGDHHRFSDLDLMIEGNGNYSRLLSQLQEQLSESNFPYKVDLVEFRDFAESYKPGYHRDRRRWLHPSPGDSLEPGGPE